MAWPEAHGTMLVQLWGEGLKAAHIADRLNKTFGTSYTKNAVVGKKHRMKLHNRQTRTPSSRVKGETQVNWNARRMINGDAVSLDQFITELTVNWQKTPTQIAERINNEWPLSSIGVYATHAHVFARLNDLGVAAVKARQTPKTSARGGDFHHAPAQFETAPRLVDVAALGASNELRMGTNERNSCKWPTSDDARNMTTCGRLITVGSYCATHGALAYQVAPSKRRTATIARPQEFADKPKSKVRGIEGNRKHHVFETCEELPHASEWLSHG